MKKENIVIIVSLLAYALGGFAYVHGSFVSKDTFELVQKQLDRIEKKLDRGLQ